MLHTRTLHCFVETRQRAGLTQQSNFMPLQSNLTQEEVPATADLDPANEFLGSRVTTMSDSELEAYIANLRAASSNAVQVKKLCSLDGASAPKKKKKAAGINIASLI